MENDFKYYAKEDAISANLYLFFRVVTLESFSKKFWINLFENIFSLWLFAKTNPIDKYVLPLNLSF